MLEDFRLMVFMAVADKGSFTVAAKGLGISQPSVSQNIAELEKSVNAELFVRTRGSVSLTPAGIAFREYAERILYWYSAAGQMFGPEGKLTSRKPVRISADGFIASHILPQALYRLLAFNPALSFSVHTDDDRHDIRFSVKRHETEPSLEDSRTFLFSVTASAVTSNSAYSGITDMRCLPQGARLAVLDPYSDILPLDLKARVALVTDSAEAIARLVAGAPDVIGILPLPTIPNALHTLPAALPDLTVDVHLEVSADAIAIASPLRRILCDQHHG